MFLDADPRTGMNKCINCKLDINLSNILSETFIIVIVPENKLIMKSSSQ